MGAEDSVEQSQETAAMKESTSRSSSHGRRSNNGSGCGTICHGSNWDSQQPPGATATKAAAAGGAATGLAVKGAAATEGAAVKGAAATEGAAT
jgi:hypothetical protein